MLAQNIKMKVALNERVIPQLIQKGFFGKYPNFRREINDRIELIGFFNNKYGGSFNVEISIIFPKHPKDQSNYYTHDYETMNEVTVFSTYKRFRLRGMFDGWFYYTDVYKSTKPFSLLRSYDIYESVSEQRSKSFIPGMNQTQVQAADDGLYARIADEVNRQLEEAYVWWKKYDTPTRLKKAK